MKKIAKGLAYVVGGLILFAAAFLVYVKLALPNVGAPPEMKVELTPERIKRGEYLANHVAVCMDCHSSRDVSRFSAPLVPGTLGKGGIAFSEAEGFPGTFYSRNITPAGLKDWTDGEIYRAITSGVSKDGHALFPVMPYGYYARMDTEDIKDIIAYVRSLPAIGNAIPESKPSFPFNIILNTIPQKPTPGKRPSEADELAYGKYLTMSAACQECHTPVKNGQIIEEASFTGGRDFQLPNGTLYTSNLTPDKQTGLGNWTKAAFIARFKAFGDSSYHAPVVKGEEFQTIMPWTMYGGMKDTDLGAIFTYLQTLEPVSNPLALKKFQPR